MTTAAPFTPAEQAGIKDFWETYEAHYDEIYQDLMKSLERLPQLWAAVRRMTPQEMDAQNRQSRDLLRNAVLEGAWQPLFENSRQQGAVYAAMGVSFVEWFELVGDFQKKLVARLVSRFRESPDRLVAALVGMGRYLDVAMSVIGDEYLKTKERIIGQQQEAIQELSTPVLQVRERLLLVPLVGVLDSARARLLTESLLRSIRAHRAKAVVLDITGVGAVDSKVANHLLQTVAAVRLMGARAIVTGLSADVAQALVALGVDLGRMRTVGDLQGGLEEAERLLGYKFVRGEAPFSWDAE
jgi:rsbT co-antagonist protein RsbR